jgi:hypothetical protein
MDGPLGRRGVFAHDEFLSPLSEEPESFIEASRMFV